ncbi:methyl-accepting chemotaxis protein [Lachnospiraceae bacterium KM106-2]|nr:methyl-accepting chemotaxis protein [Lachnospiraceae bacterium KM106-2]
MNQRKTIAMQFRKINRLIGITIFLLIAIYTGVLFLIKSQLSDFYHQSFYVVTETSALCSELESMENDMYKALLLQNDSSLTLLESSNKTLSTLQKEVTLLSSQSAEYQKWLTALNNSMKLWVPLHQDMIKSCKNEDYQMTAQIFNNQYKLLLDEGKKSLQSIKQKALTSSSAYYARIEQLQLASILCVSIGALIGIFAVFTFIKRLKNSILPPLQSLTELASSYGKGQLRGQQNFHSDNEFGLLAQTMEQMAQQIYRILSDIESVTSAFTNRNLNAEISENYDGDFYLIQTALEQLSQSIKSPIKQMETCSNDLIHSASTLSNSSEHLLGLCVEQSDETVKLQHTLEALSDRITQNLDTNNHLLVFMQNCTKKGDQGQEDMKELMESVSATVDLSANIQSILSQLQKIAKTTKLLALNASIEAARAGDQGNSFHVVAEQISTLAEESTTIASKANQFISDSLVQMERCQETAFSTNRSLRDLNDEIQTIFSRMQSAADSLRLGVDDIGQVTNGLSTITDKTEETVLSARKNQSLSSSLQSQADALTDIVGQYQL